MKTPEPIAGLGEGGTDRFVIVRRLGQGGMGVVYEAHDQERNTRVALKSLTRVNPASLYRFKREFRLLANVSHPNLVQLYELVAVENHWFFTMEYVDGVDFLAYVRGDRASSAKLIDTATSPGSEPVAENTLDTRDCAADLTPLDNPAGADHARLEAALAQLAEGVSALHETGHLHRDIKPSNILVTREGRVVVLDFGVITELAGERYQTDVAELVGTPAYMAPELATLAATSSEASDWYSVGVVLYEALTGRRPLSSTGPKHKTIAPVPPRKLRPELPEHLADLCMELLAATPEARPTGKQVLERLGPIRAESAPIAEAMASGDDGVFVGRRAQMDQLRHGFAETQDGAGVTIYIHGGSGMGKTALVHQFLDQVAVDPQVAVLTGRCYERELVPYKAIDSLVDSLARYLLSLARHQAEILLPRDIVLLARVFPVLQRVEAIARARRRSAQAPDPQELKRRAFAALRELLARLAEQRPVVLFIDDLQWGDVDSAPFLADLMRPPDAPPLLLVSTYRSEDSDSPILRALLRRDRRLGPGANVRRVEVDAMTEAEALELAALLVPADGPADAATTITGEANGNPFLIHELARFVAEGAETGSEVSLEAVIRARVARLPEPARRLLEVIAVAGKPLRRDTIERAAELDASERSPLIELQASNLVRASGARDADAIEPYHSRIGETVLASLPDALRQAHHLRLAFAIQVSDRPDPESLADHFRAAGEHERAADYAKLAAAQAVEALAFDRASQLYRQALEIGSSAGEERRQLQTCLADALANAGRGPESAAAYLVAVNGAPAGEALELKQAAALQFVKTGYMDDGITLMREVLSEMGFSLARSPRRALFPLLLRRIHLRLRGLGFKAHDTSEIKPVDITRIDVCHSSAAALAMVDTFRGADFQTRNLILALRAGDTYRIARALCYEVGFAAMPGSKGRRRVEKLVARTLRYAEELGRPELLGFVSATTALAEYLVGNFTASEEKARAAIKLFRDECAGVHTEWASTELYLLWSLHYLGKIGEMSERLRLLLAEAEEKGNLYAATSFRTGPQHIAWLLTDDPRAAYEDAEEAARSRAAEGFHLQNYWTTYALTQCDLYTGEYAAAYERICGAWDHLRKVLVFRIQFCRLEATQLRARCAVAAATVADDPGPLLRAASRAARRIEREQVAWATPLGRIVRAGIACQEGAIGHASELLATARAECLANHMQLYARVCQRRRGELLGDASGDAEIIGADNWMTEQGIANPARLTAMFAPGIKPE